MNFCAHSSSSSIYTGASVCGNKDGIYQEILLHGSICGHLRSCCCSPHWLRAQVHAVLATLRHVVRDLHSSRVPHRQLPPRHVHQDPQEGASQRRQEEVSVMFQIFAGHMLRFTLFLHHLYWTCASSFIVVTLFSYSYLLNLLKTRILLFLTQL